MSDHWKLDKNPSQLPEELWFCYVGYLKGIFKSFKLAIASYEKDVRDPLCFIMPSTSEIRAIDFIKKHINE